MSEKKVELKEEMLDTIIGGLSYSNIDKTIWANDGSTPKYHYEDFKAVMAFVYQYYEEGMTSKEFDPIVIPKLLEAGIIHE